MIEIKTGSEQPIADQIVDQYRVKIATGKLSEGDKLPSVRELAFQLSVNSKTISRAYAKLTDLGLVVSQKGKGLFVDKTTIDKSPEQQQVELDKAIDVFINSVIGLDFSVAEISSRFSKKLEHLYRNHEGDNNE
ncbi:MAG: GntR family transcriptional regulator [Alteromonadaceae bacterium]|nr:GntR family transcriptional regulator [Alteromonadaceae bacterium]